MRGFYSCPAFKHTLLPSSVQSLSFGFLFSILWSTLSLNEHIVLFIILLFIRLNHFLGICHLLFFFRIRTITVCSIEAYAIHVHYFLPPFFIFFHYLSCLSLLHHNTIASISLFTTLFLFTFQFSAPYAVILRIAVLCIFVFVFLET